jgi:hypothetical protein
MPGAEAAVVELVREFLWAHLLARKQIERFRSGELQFAELTELVGDDEASALFRLKERCHELFRPGPGSSRAAVRREELFDLAVGSLFHEAMSFRENFYQREVYGPRVRALRSEAGEDALFREFEKILGTADGRLEEGSQEVEALLDRTREQLAELLVENRTNGHLARYLIERGPLVAQVFGAELDEILARIHGGAAAGYELAGRSYLSSGYYGEGEGALQSAVARGGERASLLPLCAYARGMAAYLKGAYAECVQELRAWLDASAAPEAPLASLAQSAVARIRRFAQGDGQAALVSEAGALHDGLAAVPARAR